MYLKNVYSFSVILKLKGVLKKQSDLRSFAMNWSSRSWHIIVEKDFSYRRKDKRPKNKMGGIGALYQISGSTCHRY
jgi:hypothetical protein